MSNEGNSKSYIAYSIRILPSDVTEAIIKFMT